MTLARLLQRSLAPAAQTIMIFGIVALCQPWSLLLHRYSVTIILIGLVGFTVSAHIGPRPEGGPQPPAGCAASCRQTSAQLPNPTWRC